MKHPILWEIITSSELVLKLPEGMPVPPALIKRIYSGSGMRYMETPVPRKFTVSIVTKAIAPNGDEHTHRMTYITKEKVMLSQLMNHVKGPWLDRVDEDLKGFNAVSAHARAVFPL